LTFTFAVNLPGAAPGMAEERQKGEAMRESYVGAVKATLARVRALRHRADLYYPADYSPSRPILTSKFSPTIDKPSSR
jgi:hypothetical protein